VRQYPRAMAHVRVSVLGPLDVSVDGTRVAISGPLPRRLLAVLASRARHTVPVDTLIDSLWRGEPPAGAVQTLQSHVARLRRQLPEDVIQTRPEGYCLEAEVDAAQLEAALRAGDCRMLRDLLTAWESPAYDGLADDGLLAIEAQRLHALRSQATEVVARNALKSGELDGVSALLEALLAEQPTHETLWELLMTVLAREGRTAEALKAFQRARQTLRDELGIDPGDALRRLEHDVLTGEPSITSAPPRVPREGGEQRQIVLLVLEAPDDEDDNPEYVVQARTRLLRLVTEYGGELQPSPGWLTYVTFGARHAHEDDPERAVAAARDALTLGLAVRAGVATGPALTGRDGIAAVAPTVARRAESACRDAAGGNVVLDEDTRARLEITKPSEPRRFIGRGRELADLAADLERVTQRSTPLLVTLLGEPGMGKSRLAAAFLATLGDDVHAISVRVPAYGVATGRGLIQKLVGSDIEEGHGSRYDAFRYGEDRLVAAAGGRPQVLYLDDMQWADDLLVDFVEDLVRSAGDRALMVLVTARPELVSQRQRWGSIPSEGRHARLGPLRDEEIRELVSGVEDVEALTARAGGVPLYALELARMGSAAATPDSLRAVVAARIDTLGEAPRSLLVDAAVAGDAVVPELLSSLTGQTGGDVRRMLDDLAGRDFLRRTANGLAFAHDVVRETAYATLVGRERGRKHLAVATWADDRDVDPAWFAHHALTAWDAASRVGDADTAELARPRAYRAAMAAGKQILMLEPTAAARLFERSAALASEEGTERAWAEAMWGSAESMTGEFAAAEKHLGWSVEALAGDPDPWRVFALTMLCNTRFALGGDLAEAGRLLRAAMADAPTTRETLIGAFYDLANEMMAPTREGFRNALALADRHLADAQRAGLESAAGQVHAMRGRARLALGDAGGLVELRDGVAAAGNTGTPMATILSKIYLCGALHHWAGPADELAAREDLESYATTHGQAFVVSFSIAERVRCLAELGRWTEVVALADTVDVSEAPPRWAVVQRALALAELGELTAADVELVRRTPPASSDDLRHVLGTMLVEAIWTPDRIDELIDALGDLTTYGERDGTIELLTRLVRVAPHRDFSVLRRTEESSPLAAAIAPHLNGLLDRDAAQLLVAEKRWRAMGHVVEADLAALDAAALSPAG
jgi:DNA-binding SARP family transcriptional activator